MAQEVKTVNGIPIGTLGDIGVFTTGSGEPTGGDNGDSYLDTDTLYFYQKIAGVWTELFQGVPIS